MSQRGAHERCKRCGYVGHRAKTCELMKLGRPGIEDMRERLKGVKGNRDNKLIQRAGALEKFDQLIEYIYTLEAHRFSLAGALRAYVSAPPGKLEQMVLEQELIRWVKP